MSSSDYSGVAEPMQSPHPSVTCHRILATIWKDLQKPLWVTSASPEVSWIVYTASAPSVKKQGLCQTCLPIARSPSALGLIIP